MKSVLGIAALVGFLVSGLSDLHAQEAEPTCTSQVRPSGILSGWNDPAPMTAESDSSKASSAMLKVGQAVRMALRPSVDVQYPVAPRKPGKPDSYGGLAQLSIQSAGTYRVAVGTPAWIDIVVDGQAVASTSHAHGPSCTGIRKMVDFKLQPGLYVLQFAANPGSETTALVVPLE